MDTPKTSSFDSGNPSETRLQVAVKSESRKEILRTLRDMLAERFDGASRRDSAALARQFQLVCEELAELEGSSNSGSNSDTAERKEKWAARMARAKNSDTG